MRRAYSARKRRSELTTFFFFFSFLLGKLTRKRASAHHFASCIVLLYWSLMPHVTPRRESRPYPFVPVYPTSFLPSPFPLSITSSSSSQLLEHTDYTAQLEHEPDQGRRRAGDEGDDPTVYPPMPAYKSATQRTYNDREWSYRRAYHVNGVTDCLWRTQWHKVVGAR